jgi:hypothetical protein
VEEFKKVLFDILEITSSSHRQQHESESGSEADAPEYFVADPRELICGEFEHGARGFSKLLNVDEDKVVMHTATIGGVAPIEEDVKKRGDRHVLDHGHSHGLFILATYHEGK